jgi:hypothetical protein
MKKTVIKNGYFHPKNRATTVPPSEGLDLAKEIRKELSEHKVPFVQPCCVDECGPEVPVRAVVNEATDAVTLELYDCTTEDWIDLVVTDLEVTNLTVESVLSGTQIAAFYPQAAQETRTGAGAVNVTSYLTLLVSTGAAQAITLANGTSIGQMKKIKHYTDGGSMVLTPANLAAGTTITFTTVGEVALLQWDGTDWVVLELGNESGTALPALA